MTTSPRHWLLRDISQQRLDEMYTEDYYWYLRADEFRSKFLQPIGTWVSKNGGPVLDVGCGEGWLAEYIDTPYAGIEGSTIAVQRATEYHPTKQFYHANIIDPPDLGEFKTAVFGGILHCLIKQEYHSSFLEAYRAKYGLQYMVIYDLSIADWSALDSAYLLVTSWVGSVAVPGINRTKRNRKVGIYQCT